METSSKQDTIGLEEARQAIATGEAQAVDVRDKDDWLDGHIPGSLHAAGDQLEARLKDLSEEKPVIVVGDDVSQCEQTVGALRERGYKASVLEGGMKAWKDEKF